MTIESEIQALLDKAEPLRVLPPEEGERLGLGKLIDQVNALRAEQASAVGDAVLASFAGGGEAEPEVVKRKPGRPPKAAIEGADAE